ncbi:hypothetical protein ES703_19513 [subsurface metagenome]
MLAGLPSWLWIPDATYDKYGPGLKIVMEWANWAWWLGIALWGKDFVQVKAWVNFYIKHMAGRYVIASKAGMVLAYTLPAAIMVLIVWILNPSHTDFVDEYGYPWRYIMSYNEYFWWADLVRISSKGFGQYITCGEISVGPVLQFRDQGDGPGRQDTFEFGYSWVQERSRVGMYERWYWNLARLEFIGFMTHLHGGYYALHYDYRDPWIQDISWPWSTDIATLCKCARVIP